MKNLTIKPIYQWFRFYDWIYKSSTFIRHVVTILVFCMKIYFQGCFILIFRKKKNYVNQTTTTHTMGSRLHACMLTSRDFHVTDTEITSTSTFVHSTKNQDLTQIKRQRLLRLFSDYSIWCYKLIDNIN